MATEAEPTLAGEFPPATEEQWLALVDKVLKGAPLSRLQSSTAGGITVEPLYTEATSPGADDKSGFPGAAPFTRGSSAEPRPDGAWGIRTLLSTPDPIEANKTALRELERGSTELLVRFDAAFRAGVHPSDSEFAQLGGTDGVLIASAEDLEALCNGVYLDLAPVYLQPGSGFARAADLLIEVWNRSGIDPSSAVGGIGADPLGVLAAEGNLPQGLEAALTELGVLALGLHHTHPQVRSCSVDTSAYVEAGASEIQELAVMLSTAAVYLKACADAGLGIDDACSQIEVTLSVDADVFTGIAKLRAARRVFAALVAACGASPASQAMQMHVRTASRMMTRRDPWVNLLRVTSASLAAGLGGAASVTSLPFDVTLGEPEELGRRMARNTQLLLQEESNLGRVTDPTGGSWYVESLTDQIAHAAWAEFQRIEGSDGLVALLLDGRLATEIEQVRNARLTQVATREQAITGVSEFPNLAEDALFRPEPDLGSLRSRAASQNPSVHAAVGGLTPTLCAPLPKVRWAQEFEALRDASDAHLLATGERPKLFLVNLGPVAVHTARATFAKNFFEAGGIETVTSELGATLGFDDPEQAVAEVHASQARLVCLCSSDRVYAEQAQNFAQALSLSGLAAIYLAGNPGDRREDELAAGVTEFVHVGVNALELLSGALQAAGVKVVEVEK